ncbi:hypothetical protein [Rhizobium leguminosarum]|uniref:Uncharacterized protein n=1 Tax=Rhizobium leguminosarum TaxID=384 RepID=A0A1B1CHZ6_RHILE|nr:hypothetical protein [Rhizobium leguminosarum]ANP89346.1 hypothetical protein BA011_26660 [Rhizobium leguminosarum]
MIETYDKAHGEKLRLWFPFAVSATITITTIIARPYTAAAAERIKLPTAIEKCEDANRTTCVVDGDTQHILLPRTSPPFQCPRELRKGLQRKRLSTETVMSLPRH